MHKHRDDLQLAAGMIRADLLTEIRPEKIRELAPEGAILITCGDRDRVTGHFTGCQNIVPIHLISLNGGALLLSEGVDALSQQVITTNCREAMSLKGIRFIFCLSHFPCGKGDILDMNLKENILANLRAKNFLKNEFGSTVGVLSIVGIDWREAGLPGRDGVCLYSTGRDKQHAIKNFELGCESRSGVLRHHHSTHGDGASACC